MRREELEELATLRAQLADGRSVEARQAVLLATQGARLSSLQTDGQAVAQDREQATAQLMKQAESRVEQLQADHHADIFRVQQRCRQKVPAALSFPRVSTAD